MVSPHSFIQTCLDNQVGFFTGVPDSLLKSFCAYLTDHVRKNHVIAANEGGAVGLATGHYLATGHPALVYMQNSGQGNAVNPLASLADPDVYGIPMLLLVGWRGEPGVKDEPQHVRQGKITLSLFETMDIPVSVLPEEEPAALTMLKDAIAQCVRDSRPVALVVRKGLFEPYTLQNKAENLCGTPREQAIEDILRRYPNAVFVTTTGMISREVYETRERLGQDHSRDFLTVGSMGHASMIATGIAMARPDLQVVCLDGDGASLMHMGNMAIAGQAPCPNLLHIVLNNAAHDSVGGQPTVADRVDLSAVAKACGYCVNPEFPGRAEVMNDRAPTFVEIHVAKGARPDLGRPKTTPAQNRDAFMARLRG